ncbi:MULTISPECIES: hypothetical protein [unclassified Fredinandcohnia]|uniref:hypothetical protein n=1 Tax=unclassified Fredinandcohnia TaxID=2837514 RepID=UPI0030FD8063
MLFRVSYDLSGFGVGDDLLIGCGLGARMGVDFLTFDDGLCLLPGRSFGTS